MLIYIITHVAFKEKVPIFAVVALLGAVALAAAFMFQRAPEEKFRDAAIEYAGTLGGVRDVQVHGDVADIILSDGSVVFAEFKKKAGKWIFVKDLAKEFGRMVQDKAHVKEMMDRLAEKLSERYKVPEVGFRKGIKVNYQIVRDDRGLLGTVGVGFGVTPPGKTERTGRFIERYRYKEGAWTRQGKGSLLEKMRQ